MPFVQVCDYQCELSNLASVEKLWIKGLDHRMNKYKLCQPLRGRQEGLSAA